MNHLIFVKLACIPNFSFLSELEVTFPGWGGVGGWLDTDDKTNSVQLDLTGTATGTELGNIERYIERFHLYQLVTTE